MTETTPAETLQLHGEKVFKALQIEAYSNAADKGFHDHDAEMEDRIFAARESGDEALLKFLLRCKLDYLGNRLMLLVSETSESHEELRNGKPLDYVYYRADGKPEGLRTEMADLAIRLFDTAEALGLNLFADIMEKMTYNSGRPAMHGRQF